MNIIDAYEIDGFVDFIVSLFAVVPAGFLLGMLVGVVSFGAFKILAMLRQVAR